MNEIKIIYCYDESKNVIYYKKTTRGNKYFCIDCGEELIYKEGNIKTKHLAHKNIKNCHSTGESIFHKHWKENLFKAGMYISLNDNQVEIYEVLNEISLNKRYSKKWDIEIIVDILLVTEQGDIVVEINYKNPKDWLNLKKYYDELDLLEVYEIKVGKNINDVLIWQTKDEIINYLIEKSIKIEEDKINKENKEEQKKRMKESVNEENFYFNYKTKLQKVNDNECIITCLVQSNYNKYKKIILKFKLNELGYTYKQLYNIFNIKHGIKYLKIIIKGDVQLKEKMLTVEVIKFGNIKNANYDKDLYIKLCKLTEDKESKATLNEMFGNELLYE